MMILDSFTTVCCAVILAAFVAAWMYVAKSNDGDLNKRKKWIEQLPSVISTLGVLGTFLGITRGLVSFDTSTLDTSIPILLDGLKTAFFTSLLGMAGSLILNRVVSAKLGKVKNESETDKAARIIVDAMNANQRELARILKDSNENLVQALSKDDTDNPVKLLRQDVEQLKDDLEEIKGLVQEVRELSKALGDIADELPRLRAVAMTATASVAAIDNNAQEIEAMIHEIVNHYDKEDSR